MNPPEEYAHRLAIMLECMLLNPLANWVASAALLDEYYAAVRKWHEENGDGHVSPLGKD